MPRKYHRGSEVDRILQPFAEDIRSGASDEDISKRTSLSVRTIQRWRLQYEMKKPRGTGAKKAAVVYAVGLLGESLGDVKHRTADSCVKGLWEPPVFLTREHIDYRLFLKLLDAGARLQGMSEAELVRALGVSAVNVSQGLQLLRAGTKGTPCPTCGHLTPEMFCSAICARAHRRRREVREP